MTKTKTEVIIRHTILIAAVSVLLLPGFIVSDASPSAQPQPAYPYTLDNHSDPSMTIIIVVLVCAFFFIGIFTIFLRHCTDIENAAEPGRAAPFTENSRRRAGGLDLAVMETFPVFLYAAVKDLKIGKGSLECAICLSEFEDDDTLRLIPKCDHVFHPDCIGAWLASHVTCPVCRAKLSPESSKRTGDENQTGVSGEINVVPEAEPENNEVVVNVNNEEDEVRERQENKEDPKLMNRPARTRVSGKFPRSHSTGHSLVQPGENTERYTLRLPEEVRKQLMMVKLKRTRSYDGVLGRNGSSRTGGGGGGGGGDGSSRGKRISERWIFSMTPPFVSRGNGVRSRGDGEGSNGKTLVTVVKTPLDCLRADEGQQQSSSRPAI